MQWFLAALATGAITFATTNINDIFLLMLFFSQVNKTFHRWHIVAGQFLGFTVLVLMSLFGFLIGLLIPRAWIGPLGMVPILLSVQQWLNHTKEDETELAEQA